MILIGGVLSRYGACGGPISGVRTGLGHVEEDHYVLASTERLQSLIYLAKRRRGVLPVVASHKLPAGRWQRTWRLCHVNGVA
jgi:hypothetical protein